MLDCLAKGRTLRKPADSLILALANLAIVGAARLLWLTHIGCCMLGSPANVLEWIVSPILLFFTVGYSLRDLFRQSSRLQAIFALVLSIPGGMLLLSIKL